MRFYAQIVSEALLADPPMIRGLIDGDTIRRFRFCRGSGKKRIFVFDIAGELTLRDLLARKDLVALAWSDANHALEIKGFHKKKAMLCPQCGLEMLTTEFWTHYNTFHARRMWWPNKEHWSKIGLKGEYLPPPEQR